MLHVPHTAHHAPFEPHIGMWHNANFVIGALNSVHFARCTLHNVYSIECTLHTLHISLCTLFLMSNRDGNQVPP